MHTLQNLFAKMKKVPKKEAFDLQKLINERKQEKMRSTRDAMRRDLHVIADRRKYDEDLDGFPEGAFHRLKQEYIWEDVLGYLTDSSDITSSSFACLTFGEILEERRMLILLPEILSILQCGSKTCNEPGLLSTKDLLGVRRTSRSWKTETDRKLLKPNILGEFWYDKNDNEQQWKLELDMCVFWNVKSVEDAFTLLSKKRGEISPLVQKIYVNRSLVSSGQEMVTFLDKILEFLKFHGNWVQIFVYEGTREVDDYLHLHDMMNNMPNLESLICAWIGKLAEDCSNEELELFENILTDKPFPNLDSLKSFQIVGVMNEPWVEHVLVRCSNLKDISCIDGNISPVNLARILEKAPLERLVVQDERFILSPELTTIWQLKVLEILFNHNEIKRSALWTALNRFQETLEALSIDLIIKNKKDDPSIPLQLPHLKFLQLYVISRRTIGFDDLLPLKSLETLIVHSAVEGKQRQDKNLIKTYGIHEMEKSNIWDCFPNLTKLEFSDEYVGYRRNGSTFSKFKVIQKLDLSRYFMMRGMFIDLRLMR